MPEPFSVVELDALELVGTRVRGTFRVLEERVPSAWQKLVRARGREDGAVFYGVTAAVDGAGAEPEYDYWVTTTMDAFESVPASLKRVEVPPKFYALATVRGPASRIPETYVALERWMHEKALHGDKDGVTLERFDPKRQSVVPPYGEFDYDILKPIVA